LKFLTFKKKELVGPSLTCVERVFDILNNPCVQVFEKKGIEESLVLAISKPSKNCRGP
jgi:hypothetical protein